MECRENINNVKTVCIYFSLSLFVFRYFSEAVKIPVKTFFLGGGVFYTVFSFLLSYCIQTVL